MLGLDLRFQSTQCWDSRRCEAFVVSRCRADLWCCFYAPVLFAPAFKSCVEVRRVRECTTDKSLTPDLTLCILSGLDSEDARAGLCNV